MEVVNGILRRNRIDLLTPSESLIFAAQQSVEVTGCHPLLTEAAILLRQARDKVADYIDQEQSRQNKMKTLPVLTTLEDYLKANIKEGCEFRLVIKNSVDGNVETPEFYIHPLNRNGDTLDYKVSGNVLECVSQVAV